MPTGPAIPGPSRVFFSSFDGQAPPHVHVPRARMVGTFWLTPVVLSPHHGCSPRALHRIRAMLREQRDHMLEAGHDHCGGA
jgi:hypothetical protein